MNTQFLEYVRQQLMVATADLSGATKGQLMAWLENAQFDTGTFKRKKPRVQDEVTGKMITLDNPPIPGKQSHAKGSHIPLVQPVEYSTASWRRALMSLEEHQKAWLLWNYSENVRWCYQVEITQWGWQQFSQQLAGKRVAKKTIERLRQLIWLAAQDVKNELAGRDVYQYGLRITWNITMQWSVCIRGWTHSHYIIFRDHVHNKRQQIISKVLQK